MAEAMSANMQNTAQNADRMLGVLKSMLDNIDAMVYVSDMETHELLFVNKSMREGFHLDGDAAGCICWEVLQEGKTERCSFCPVTQLEKDPTTPLIWEAYNTRLGKTFRNLDSVIEWTNGKQVHMEFAIDISDMRRTQKEADSMQSVLRNILNGLNAFIYVSDMDTDEILFTNKKMLEVFDLTAENVIGQTCWRVFQEGFTERCSFCPSPKLAADNSITVEWDECNTVTGRNYKNVDSIIEWIGGKKVHMQHSTDVTDILEAQREVEEANRRLGMAISASNAGVWEIDFTKDLYTYDARNAQLLGQGDAAGIWTIDEMADHFEKHAVNIPADQIDSLRSKRTKNDWPMLDVAMRMPDGSIRYIRINGTAQRDAEGYVLRVAGMNIDITDSVLLEQTLKAEKKAAEDKGRAEADERTQIMLDATPLAASFWDADGNMLDCNMECVRLFGMQKKEDYIEHFYDVNPEFQPDGQRTSDKAVAEITAALKTGYRKFEWMYRDLNGDPLPVETTLVRVTMRGEDRIAAYSRDLREIRASEQARSEAMAYSAEMELQATLALAASEAKTQFLSNMSHEIRTPMNAIIGMATLLKEGELNERQRGYTTDILSSATSLMEIINDILDISKIEAGKMELIPVDYDFEQFLHEIETMFAFSARDKGISFELETGGKLPRFLYGDNVRLRQILTNILGNSIKFTNEGGVTLSVNARDDRLYFRIADTGIGMKKEDIPKIFTEFMQLNDYNNRSLRGTGLGLPIVKNLIEQMGGVFMVDSEVAQGTVFSFDIPLVAGNPIISNAKTAETRISAPDAQVLVVDDNEINLLVVCDLLEYYDINCDTAKDGVEAIEKIENKKYDLVFMDHMMPVMDGIEATRRLRKNHSAEELVIVALTANAIDGAKQTMLASGMNDYLSKPIGRDPLVDILLKWLPEERITHCPQ